LGNGNEFYKLEQSERKLVFARSRHSWIYKQ